MARLGDFLGSALFYTGINPTYQREADAKQAQVDLAKMEVTQAKMNITAMQQRQQIAQQIGSLIQSTQQSDATTFQNPLKMAEMYDKASATALAGGDFEGSREYSSLAKQKSDEAKEQQTIVMKQQQNAKDKLGSSALDFQQNPTQANYASLVQDAIKAGVNPTTIPKDPNSAAFKSWATQQITSGMSSKDRVEMLQKSREQDENRRLRLQEHEDNVRDRAESRRQTLMLRNATLGIEGARLDIERQRLKMEQDKVTHPNLTAQERTTVTNVIGAAAESIRGIRLISAMPPGQTAGPLTSLQGANLENALVKTGGNILTPQNIQMYQTATKGLGKELGRILTLGGQQGMNMAQVKEMRDMVEVQPGDTEYEAMFKLANAADIVRTRLEALPDHPDPKVNQRKTQMLQDLSKVPSPDKVLQIAMKHKQGPKLINKFQNMGQAMQDILTPASPGKGKVPDLNEGLPEGWSVKVH